jgi:hypothetical protein
MSGEDGLEAADAAGVTGDGNDAHESDDHSSSGSVSTDNFSAVSSPKQTHVLQAIGVEVSAEDKEIMIKTFLEGTASPTAFASEPMKIKSVTDVSNKFESELHVSHQKSQLSNSEFFTPPTKLLSRHGVDEIVTENAEIITEKALSHVQASIEAPSPEKKTKPRFEHLGSFKSATSKSNHVDHHVSAENNGSQDGTSLLSERHQRDRKMALIIFLCSVTFVIFNISAYLYLRPVKVGSAPFDELHLLLELRAQSSLPKSRFFPILSHVVSLMNPLLTTVDRQIQSEHLKSIIVEFQDSLSRWQLVYDSKKGLSSALKEELLTGNSMYICLYSSKLCVRMSCTHFFQVIPFGFLHNTVVGIRAICQSTMRFIWEFRR